MGMAKAAAVGCLRVCLQILLQVVMLAAGSGWPTAFAAATEMVAFIVPLVVATLGLPGMKSSSGLSLLKVGLGPVMKKDAAVVLLPSDSRSVIETTVELGLYCDG